jgi:hypothetical protein
MTIAAERVESFGSEMPAAGHPRRRRWHRRGVQLAADPTPFLRACDQSRGFKHGQVLYKTGQRPPYGSDSSVSVQLPLCNWASTWRRVESEVAAKTRSRSKAFCVLAICSGAAETFHLVGLKFDMGCAWRARHLLQREESGLQAAVEVR